MDETSDTKCLERGKSGIKASSLTWQKVAALHYVHCVSRRRSRDLKFTFRSKISLQLFTLSHHSLTTLSPFTFNTPSQPPTTMPKSKRSKVTTLTKTPSRTNKASKLALVSEIQQQVDNFDHVWLFSVGDMRNEGLKEVRAQWRGTGRMFFGKGRVMAKALGLNEGEEYKEGLHKLAKVSEA